MRRLILASAALLLVPALHAQVAEVYGTFSPLHASNINTDSNAGTKSFWTEGVVGGGVTLNFLNLHFVKLGFDLRGSTRPGTNGADTALFGLKLTVQPPLLHIKPYIQASGGYLATRTDGFFSVQSSDSRPRPHDVTGSFTETTQDAVYEILGGLDLPIAHFFDLRLVEVGGGKTVGNGSDNITLFTVNTGLVVHF